MTKEEQVFSVTGSVAISAEPISLSDAGLKERSDLQEWVIAHPSIMGDDILIVTTELGRWVSAVGTRESDRLDVLALDGQGRLVVAELKRGTAPDTVEMQAIKYAALANGFDLERLVQQHADFLRTQGEDVSDEDAQARLLEHAPEVSDETLRPPRIVLVAAGFSPVVTASAVFLTEVGLEISLVQFRAYRTPMGEVVITVSQLLPLPSIDEFTLTPVIARRRAEKDRTRAARVVTQLVDAEAVDDGTIFEICNLPDDGQGVDRVRDWIQADPNRGKARWQNSRSKPLIWQHDGQAYAPTRLVWEIYEAAAGEDHPSAFWGPSYWRNDQGKTLIDLVQELG